MENSYLYVQLVRLNNGELWFFKQEENGDFTPHRQIKTLIEGELVESELSPIS